MDKIQLSEIFTGKIYGFRYRFLTTAIFIGFASTVHKSLKIMF